MSQLNSPGFLDFNGEPITGRPPPSMVVSGGTPLSPVQLSGVMQAYKLFTDVTRLTLAGYVVQSRVLADGTKIRMMSINKADTVLVYPAANSEVPTDGYRGLCTYPAGYTSEDDFTPKGWAPVTVFQSVKVSTNTWTVLAKNPRQAPTPAKPPAHAALKVEYWVTTGGNVWLNYKGAKSHLSIAMKGAGDVAKEVRTGEVPTVIRDPEVTPPEYNLPDAAYGPIPFGAWVGTPPVLKKFLATSHAIAASSGKIMVEFTPMTAPILSANPANSIPARPTTQLPPAIVTDGDAVGLQAYDAVYFNDDPLAKHSTLDKNYWWTIIGENGAPFQTSAIRATKVRAMGYWTDTASSMTSGAELPIDDTMEPMTWHIVYPKNGQWFIFQVLEYNWNTMLNHFLPDFGDVTSSERRETILEFQRKDFFKFPLTANKMNQGTIGHVISGLTLAPVRVSVQGKHDRKLYAEGQHYVGVRDEAAAVPKIGDLADMRSVVGENRKIYTRIKIDIEESAECFIEVEAGGITIRTFELTSKVSGKAKRRWVIREPAHIDRGWDGNTGDLSISGVRKISADYRTGRVIDSDWESGTRTSPDPKFGYTFSESGEVREPGYAAYSAGASAWPTIRSVYGHLDTVVPIEEEVTDYLTDMSLSAASRYIVAFDGQMLFHAYVEIKVTNAPKVVARKDQIWIFDLRPVGVEQETFDNRVVGKFVCVYRGTKHEQTMFDITVKKPLVATRNTTTNWYQWDGGDTARHSQMDLISSKIYLPTPATFAGIDGVFQHQGVCPDFSGFTADEVAFQEKAGYPAGTTLSKMIYAKRFTFASLGKNVAWLMGYLELDSMKEEAKKASNAPPEFLVPYYYSPELREKILNTTYGVEFDHKGLRLWIDDIKPDPATDTPSAPHRDAVNFRI